MTALLERFMSKVEQRTDGCWEWKGRTRTYGEFDIKGTKRSHYISRRAHIVAYELLVGPIPMGCELHHSCHRKTCVNPKHLTPQTRLEHVQQHREKYERKRARTHCKYGHPYGANPPIQKRGRVCVTCAAIASRRSYERRLSLQH